jgi:cytochrome P450
MARAATAQTIPDPGRALLDPALYARDGYPDALFKRLRDEAPVFRVGDPMVPYWAITRHRDIVEICRNPRSSRTSRSSRSTSMRLSGAPTRGSPRRSSRWTRRCTAAIASSSATGSPRAP